MMEQRDKENSECEKHLPEPFETTSVNIPKQNGILLTVHTKCDHCGNIYTWEQLISIGDFVAENVESEMDHYQEWRP